MTSAFLDSPGPLAFHYDAEVDNTFPQTVSLGAAYRTEIHGYPVTFRVNGDNIFNNRYWASTGGLVLAEGLPASVKFELTTRF